MKESKKVKLSEKAEQRLKEVIALYPQRRSAIMPALYIAQEELGHVSADAVAWVAERVGVPPVHVMEVATFYTMYYKHPVGRYHFQICRTLSCAVCGAKKLADYLVDRFKISAGQVSSDGMWSFEEVECLGSCGTAPMMQINGVFFENLTIEKLAALVDRLATEQPNLSFSPVSDKLGDGFKDQPKSQII